MGLFSSLFSGGKISADRAESMARELLESLNYPSPSEVSVSHTTGNRDGKPTGMYEVRFYYLGASNRRDPRIVCYWDDGVYIGNRKLGSMD